MANSNKLFVFFGMIASGKSYLASAWASHRYCSYYNSDIVRKNLAGLDPIMPQKEQENKGIYSKEFSRKTYDELLNLAGICFSNNQECCVVLDGSYQSVFERNLLAEYMHSKAEVFFIYCECSEEITKKRLEIRAQDPLAVSDGNWEIYQAQKKKFDFPEEIDDNHLFIIDTDNSVDELIKILDHLV